MSEADEESTAYEDKSLLRQIKLHFPITDYFSEWRPPHPSITAVASNRIFAGASVIDTFSAGEGYDLDLLGGWLRWNLLEHSV